MICIAYVDLFQVNPTIYQRLYAQASPERKERADRYQRREDAVRCIAADALLRFAVKQVLGVSEFAIERNAHGKPHVKTQGNFHYNLSHSGRYAVIAYGGSTVGVDVEKLQMDAGKEGIARRFFTPEEQCFVFQEEEGCAERFFQIWTAKEAYLKYLGTGLHRPLDSFNVLAMNELHHVSLEGGYCLTLCTIEEQYTIERIAPERLLLL